MNSLFIRLYNYFSQHRLGLLAIFIVSTMLLLWCTLQIKFEEDITSFFPKDSQNISIVYKNLPAKDKLVVMFTTKSNQLSEDKESKTTSSSSTLASDNSNNNYATTEQAELTDQLISAAEEFAIQISQDEQFRENATITLRIDGETIDAISNFIYDYMPLWLESEQLTQLDSLFSNTSMEACIQRNYNQLLSPIGGYIANYIYQDPFSLAGNMMGSLQSLGSNVNYKIVDDYIFSPDQTTLLCYIDPIRKINSSSNEDLVETIEATIKQINNKYSTLHVDYFGAPAVAAHNAKQIKQDCMVTLNIAIIIIFICMIVVFKNWKAPFIALLPVIYGALFSLAIIYLTVGEISLIAVGAGSVVLGIALSYSIHLLAHSNHSTSIQQIIGELAYPLTIGSFTTIGAFVGLLFTNSKLLQDFGLFASLTLVGTTLFVLIFMPHIIKPNNGTNSSNRILVWIDSICSKHLHHNKVWVCSIIIITVLLAGYSNDVKFDSDMMNLSYLPAHLREAEERLNSFIGVDSTSSTVLFMAYAHTADDAIVSYQVLCNKLDSLKHEGKITSYSSIDQFILPTSQQQDKLEEWSKFWKHKSPETTYNQIQSIANKVGFESDAYEPFYNRLTANYQPLTYGSDSPIKALFKEWIYVGDSITSFIAQVKLNNRDKEYIYTQLSDYEGIVAVDRSFFTNKMAEDVSNNFYLILYISGLLVFIALLLSYGRIELTLISFLPMFVSWLIILGLMYIFGIDFNIVTIILSTFIFGIGDDFSIFIMDGLLSEYREKKMLLSHHKMAIFFSAFAVLIGMGSLFFAKHPAVYSLSVISVLGIVVVVLVAYTIQPFIFSILISSPAQKGNAPYTLIGLIRSIYAFSLFVLGCIILQAIILLLHLVPISKTRRKLFAHHSIHQFVRLFLLAMFMIPKKIINEQNETFKKPAVIIANHQSFIDILVLLSLHPKLVMVIKGWVWNSPFFGQIVKYLDFYHIGEGGHEALASSLKSKIDNGYSVIIFPEGTRSSDCKIKRFHKGAFVLAEQLKLDILPIVLYGNGLVSSKNQPFYIKCGLILTKILPRIPHVDVSNNSSLESNDLKVNEQFGVTYQERTKQISAYFRKEYKLVYEEYNRVSNPYFRNTIIQNYIYKGPVLEWYMRIKLHLEEYYRQYDHLVPRTGKIVDLGCGYGAISYMLGLLSSEREILGIDYDSDKIAIANNAFLKRPNISFEDADISAYPLPPADAYILSDVLHYLDRESQSRIIAQCIAALKNDGKIIIREGDASKKSKHTRTIETERWSTKILKFNKTNDDLQFISRTQIEEIAQQNSMKLEIIDRQSQTSNTLFILTHTK